MRKLSAGLKMLFALALVFLVQACASTTMITSEPAGAKVFINEQFMGTTPYAYTDEKIIFTSTYIRLEKEGYEPLNAEIERSEDPNVGAIVAGFFVWVPWLWAMDYSPVHNYELKPITTKPVTPEGTLSVDKYQKLRELKKLLDDGIITQEEFEKEKKKVLDEK